MERIKELIVVEGKHDKQLLESLYDCDVVCTNGLSLDENSLKLVKAASSKQGVIVFTDPDSAGETIRKAVAEVAPNAKHAFIDKHKCIGKRNVGVEYASKEDVKEALAKAVTFQEGQESLSWEDYLELDLMGSKQAREKVCSNIGIGYCNNKTLFKRLNMLGLTKEDVILASKEQRR